MATLFEHYNTGDNSFEYVSDDYWAGQTFTAEFAYPLTSVKFLLSRRNEPGTITLHVRAVDGDGKPTGDDLATGTTDGDTLTTSAAGEWREISLTSPLQLAGGSKYALILSCSSSEYQHDIKVRLFDVSMNGQAGYDGGAEVASDDSGVTWYSPIAEVDWMFECWGVSSDEGHAAISVVGEKFHWVGQSGTEYWVEGTPV